MTGTALRVKHDIPSTWHSKTFNSENNPERLSGDFRDEEQRHRKDNNPPNLHSRWVEGRIQTQDSMWLVAKASAVLSRSRWATRVQRLRLSPEEETGERGARGSVLKGLQWGRASPNRQGWSARTLGGWGAAWHLKQRVPSRQLLQKGRVALKTCEIYSLPLAFPTTPRVSAGCPWYGQQGNQGLCERRVRSLLCLPAWKSSCSRGQSSACHLWSPGRACTEVTTQQ